MPPRFMRVVAVNANKWVGSVGSNDGNAVTTTTDNETGADYMTSVQCDR